MDLAEAATTWPEIVLHCLISALGKAIAHAICTIEVLIDSHDLFLHEQRANGKETQNVNICAKTYIYLCPSNRECSFDERHEYFISLLVCVHPRIYVDTWHVHIHIHTCTYTHIKKSYCTLVRSFLASSGENGCTCFDMKSTTICWEDDAENCRSSNIIPRWATNNATLMPCYSCRFVLGLRQNNFFASFFWKNDCFGKFVVLQVLNQIKHTHLHTCAHKHSCICHNKCIFLLQKYSPHIHTYESRTRSIPLAINTQHICIQSILQKHRYIYTHKHTQPSQNIQTYTGHPVLLTSSSKSSFSSSFLSPASPVLWRPMTTHLPSLYLGEVQKTIQGNL